VALFLHPVASGRAPGFKGYSLYDSPKNRALPSPEAVMFALGNRGIVAQAAVHPEFRTIVEVFAEGELSPEVTQGLLEDLEAGMPAE